ncbi:MAG TPA: hypothetical protein VIU41_05905 [Geobacteraceae bacterium]
MKCPVCKNQEHADLHLHADQFDEDIMKCSVCGSTWSINHGVVEVIKDTQEHSFLEGVSECVEGDDYGQA